MAVNDELGKRMKEFYEAIPKTKLMRRTPVAIRIDGKAFHTFTKGFHRPFDYVLRDAMNSTMGYLCENIQGCVLGYCQSDEITLILIDYKHLNSDAWFGYEVQKLCSVAASMATIAFNRFFLDEMEAFYYSHTLYDENHNLYFEDEEYADLYDTYVQAHAKGAMFDARAFNVPREEVTNLVYWRQVDATRNAIQLAGQAFFSPKELMDKTCNQIKEMLFNYENINFDNFATAFKRGVCCVKGEDGQWVLDYEIPQFKGEGREYIERLIQPEEE